MATNSVTQRMATHRVTLKLLIDKRNRTVVFAEAGKDFVDFLFQILTVPVGQVIQLLTKTGKTGMVGSLGNLYDSIEELDDVFIESSKKDILLNPKAPASLSGIPSLLPETPLSSDSRPKTYYRCHLSSYSPLLVSPVSRMCGHYVAEEPYANCPGCKRRMNLRCTLVKSLAGNPAAAAPASAAESEDGKGGFVLGKVMYMVMDDLAVRPMSTISSITLLNQFKITEIGHLEEKVVSLGKDEGIKLLRTSLHSKNVLTDVFLGVKRERS